MRIALLAVLAFGACLVPSSDTAERLALSELALRQAQGERVEGRRIQYGDLPPTLQEAFSAAGIGERDFPAYVEGVETETDRRVAEGEREHLVYYALQSSRFTDRPRIEPAISALRFVEHLSKTERQRLLDDPVYLPTAGWPSAERARISALLATL